MNFRQQAEELSGGHYVCEDSWYSCPMADGGCANETEAGCNCGLEEKVVRIESALRSAYEAGLEEAAIKCRDRAARHNRREIGADKYDEAARERFSANECLECEREIRSLKSEKGEK